MGKSRVKAHLRNGKPVRSHDRQSASATRPAGSDAAEQAASAAAADDDAARRLAGYGSGPAALADKTHRDSLAAGDSPELADAIKQRIEYWERNAAKYSDPPLSKQTAALIAADERARAAFDAQETVPLPGEVDPDWQPRLRTKTEIKTDWAARVIEGIPDGMRLDLAVFGDGAVEAVMEGWPEDVCCGNLIGFDRPKWCTDCGTEHSAAVLAVHRTTLNLFSENGEPAAVMADPDKFREHAIETWRLRVAHNVASEQSHASMLMDRLAECLDENKMPRREPMPTPILFGTVDTNSIAEPFQHQFVVSRGHPNTDTGDIENYDPPGPLREGDPVTVSAWIPSITPDGQRQWTEGQASYETGWSKTLDVLLERGHC